MQGLTCACSDSSRDIATASSYPETVRLGRVTAPVCNYFSQRLEVVFVNMYDGLYSVKWPGEPIFSKVLKLEFGLERVC